MPEKDFRTIPKVDAVVAQIDVPECCEDFKIRTVREVLAMVRSQIAAGKLDSSPDAEALAEQCRGIIAGQINGSLQPVINASGVIVYTNLGRAPLAEEALNAVVTAARGYCDLEFDLDSGERGSRQQHISPITRAAFGAEDALVVNNNAAAVMLVLASLASSRQVIVSRGELVEIGGSFRMPDVMTLSGAGLKEVGTTNKTRVADYEAAITADTALIMKVHRSNFSIEGFSEEAGLKELSALARRHKIPFYIDMGSGVPFDLADVGIRHEWTIAECLEYADVVSFSGDKVLGGPQCGIILGKSELLRRMAQHPLHRAVRVDKLTIAALNATLRLMLGGRLDAIPVQAMLQEAPQAVRKRCEKLAAGLGPEAEIVATKAVVGGGTAPGKEIDSFGVRITSPRAVELQVRLRTGRPAVVCRIEDDRLTFDLKTVRDAEIMPLAERIREVLG